MTNLIIDENNCVTLTPEQAKALTKVVVGGGFEGAVLLNKYLGRLPLPIDPAIVYDEVLHSAAAYYLAISLEGRCFSGVGVPVVDQDGVSWAFKYSFDMEESYGEQITTQHMTVTSPS
ncbi:hypothetical protein ACUTSW_06185 [Serratia sp. TSA_198.1]|jgi:hypothetical protein|uniref:hypothetical protein n=1 Tax=Serratia TaxID=613 RepID=UPI0007A0BC31|nr:hypothetical protein [Serratia plymuthica]KYQ95434.1 hypothetical protein AWY96_18835 [Serratia plymuthica]NIC25465.1 hypothetical protein [Serratia plymuthica]QPS88965.1 hypothetical protein I6G46_08395 [Serratia plymuthica]